MKPGKVLTVLGSALVAACGGGAAGTVAGIDGGGALPPVATTITSQGPVTGFGSIIVNGVRFSTNSAAFNIDGASGSESDLAVGQVVIVQGTLNSDGVTGVANTVIFDDVVEGPVQSIDVGANSMVVLGQTVLVNDDTSYEIDISPQSLDGLSVGNIVEVSGYRNSNDAIVATRIELESAGSEFEVTGLATNVDTGAMSFEIGGLVIDYGAAAVNDFPNGMPEEDQLIEAKGSALGGAGELLATEIEFRGNDFDIDDFDEIEIEGLITRFASAADFDVNGVPVTTNGSTVYENGSSMDLALDRRIEVEGSLSGGVLVADEIEFEIEGSIRIGGLVEAVSGSQVTLLGITVSVDADAEFEDESPADLQTFSLSDVSVGNYLEVRAFDDGGTIVATRVERAEDPGDAFLRGLADNVSDPNFTILGITVRTDGGTSFEDDSETSIDASTFFAQAQDRVVEVTGQFVGGEILADEVELED